MHLREQITFFPRARDPDPVPATKLQQPLVTQNVQRAQNRVAVDPKNRCQIARQWQPVSRARLTLSDRAAYLGRHLLM